MGSTPQQSSSVALRGFAPWHVQRGRLGSWPSLAFSSDILSLPSVLSVCSPSQLLKYQFMFMKGHCVVSTAPWCLICTLTCRYNVSCSHQFRLKRKKMKEFQEASYARVRRRGPRRSSSDIARAKIQGKRHRVSCCPPSPSVPLLREKHWVENSSLTLTVLMYWSIL